MARSESETGQHQLAGRFTTAAGALTLAGQISGVLPAASVTFARSESTGTWWVVADMPLDVGRELIAAARGSTHVDVDGVFLVDIGWGPPPVRAAASASSAERAPADLAAVSVVDLVRISGLRPSASAPTGELTLLVPGGRIVSLVQRGLDLGLDVRYRIVRLHGLFEDGGPSWTVYEIGLQAPSSEVLPAAFIAGLDRDASVLVCRRVGPSLLIDHALSSALPDPHLAQVAELDDHTWVLASPDFGCHRLVAVGSGGYQDAAALVRLSDTYELTGPADRADNTDQPVVPVVLPVLRVVPATTRGVAIDALVLDDADLACLPTLLEGQPLAEVAFLARGRDRHLVLAPGGLLESLPLGEPLYRIGPGPLYLPLGHRLQPALPPAARRRFFPTDSDQAIALLRSDRAVAFDLVDCQPVWTLWAGPLPPIDLQIPADAIGGVVAVERALAASPETADFPGMKHGSRSARRQKITDSRPTDESDGWRDEAWRAERSGDLVAAAEIHEAHNDFRRAAHLYELAAREGRRGAL